MILIIFLFQSRSTSLRILQRLRGEDDLKKRKNMRFRLLRDFVPPFYLFEGVCDRVECKWDDKILLFKTLKPLVFVFISDHFVHEGREMRWVLDDVSGAYVKKTVPSSSKEGGCLTSGQRYSLSFGKHSLAIRDVFGIVQRATRKEFRHMAAAVTMTVHDRATVLTHRLVRIRHGGAIWRRVEGVSATSTPQGSPSSLRVVTVSGIPKKRLPNPVDAVRLSK